MSTAQSLTFAAIDDLAFAAARRLLDSGRQHAYRPVALGPLLELIFMVESGRLPAGAVEAWLEPSAAAGMIQAMRDGRKHWSAPGDRRLGFLRVRSSPDGTDIVRDQFLFEAQRAAKEVALLPGTVPGQLVAAMVELEINVHEHSEAPETGLVAFRAAERLFEFVVVDRGIGVLASLQKCPSYANLVDHGGALDTAIRDGASRHGPGKNRGYGFRPIFLGLANLNGSLRFRSGDHALLIDGTSPDVTMARLSQKAPIDGFVVSVSCRLPGQGGACA